ncbi:norbelladine synthase [Ricinus communis]|uniref:Bet v I/Major latex protein domain-containing protein n=1 Tax=Ricinus communis TaxID=3988 RepID=B9S241_RICCO|nr:norbelladine synthase [Ricinus communis]EEF42384.1 conserved hypothetical protein [Ricinus communis]|eukprot:XP_002520060.1 S-norcoclaurine synthase 2 [Ricinus communis]
MRDQVSAETPVGAPARIVWDAYRGVELGRLVDELLGDVLGKVEVVEGDGGVGTIMKLTFPPGTPGTGYMKEIFTKMDDDKRVKETEIIEGGYKDLGFDHVRIRLEIIEKDDDDAAGESSIIRSTIEYEMDETKPELASFVSTKQLEIMAETIAKYLTHNKSTTT